MSGNNRYVDDLRILASIELYLNSEIYAKHPSFVKVMNSHSGDSISTPRKMGNNFFALRGALMWKILMGGILFSSLWGDHPRFSSLIVSNYLKEKLPVVNINYLLVTYNFKNKLRHLLEAR